MLASVGVAGLLAASMPTGALASGCTDSWAKAESGAWSTPEDWSTGSVPAAADEVCITVPGEYAVTLTGSVSAKSLTLGASSGAAKQKLLVGGPLLSGTLSLGASSAINHQGVLDLESVLGASAVVQAPAEAPIMSAGEVLASAGDVNYLEAPLTNAASGVVEVKSGELRQDHNTTTVNEGVFQVESGAVFAATTSKDLFVNDGGAAGGVVDDGTVELTGDASWTQDGGESGGPVEIFNSGRLTDEGGAGSFYLLDTAGLSGTIPKEQMVSAEALPSHNAQIDIFGTVLNEGALLLDSPAGGGVAELVEAEGSSKIDSSGVLRSQSESSAIDHLKVALTNEASGVVEVKSGELRQDQNTTTVNEGVFQVESGAVFAATTSTDMVVNEGSLVAGGLVSLSGDASWRQEAGSAAQSGNPVEIFNSGALTDVSGGGSFDLLDTAGLSGTIPSGQTVSAQALSGHNATVQLSGGEVTNDGTFVLDEPSAGSAAVVGGTTFLNKGVIEAQAALSTDVNYLEAPLTNAASGVVEVKSGELRQDHNTTTVNEGVFQVESGAVFAATTSTDMVVNEAGGTLEPGIAGPTSFGVVKVSAGATFQPGGTILPNLIGGYAPAVGTEFEVISGTAPIGGEFATVANNFIGDYSKASSSPSVIAVERGRDSTATTLAAHPETTTHGQAVTLTAMIKTGQGPVGDPTGTVTFRDGATEVGTAEVSTSAGVTSAALETLALGDGHDEIVASYSGDPNFATSSSRAAEVTVDPARPTVTSLEPGSGPTGGDAMLRIRGSGFIAGSTVTIGAASASEVLVATEEEITARTPAGDPGPQPVIVTDAGGSSNSTITYIYLAPVPSEGGKETGRITTKSLITRGATTTLPAPKLAVNGNVAPVSGSVSVKLPGSSSFVTLSEARQVPFGAVVEATNGRVSVTTTEPDGTTQTGMFFGGQFILSQGKNGLVVATLTGGNFSVCPTARERSHIARISSAHASPKHVVRKLWANAHGSFSTKGNYAAGAVLGTEWLTEDLCDGTLIRVTRDKVAVTNLVNHHHLTVKAGRHYLAKAP
jgi:hypothetical protein